MNNRTRQWFKANKMMDKYDPQYLANVDNAVLIFRESKLEEMKEKYGDKLMVIVGRECLRIQNR